jgi:hypothetical protein
VSQIHTETVHTTVAAGAPCSDRCYELEGMSKKALETVLLRGTMPEPGNLIGWEFRGTNVPGWAKVAGIKKFIKGFYLRDGEAFGYNCPVVQSGINAPWIAKPDDDNPKRFGFYRVAPADPTSRDNEYLNAVLLDYGRGGNKKLDPTAGLRDYLVQVDPGNPDLYLGKAYYALGPLRVATNFFILERHRRGLSDVSFR